MLGFRDSDIPAGHERNRQQRFLRQSAERDCQEASVGGRRFHGSFRLRLKRYSLFRMPSRFLGREKYHFGFREHAMGAILNGLALAKYNYSQIR